MKSSTFFQTILRGIVLAHSVLNISFAQEFDHSTYTWESKPSMIQLSEEEKKQSSLLLLSKKFVEYKTSKEAGVEKFTVTHTIEAVNDDRAVEASNKIYVPINYYSKLIDIKTRVIQNGKVVVEQGMKDVKKLEEKEVQYYLLALEGLGKGSIIETIISLQLSPSLYSRDYLQENENIRVSEFTLVAPKNLIFKSKSYNATLNPKDTVIGDKRYVLYSMQNVPAHEKEKYSLENANMVRVEYAFEKNTEYLVARGERWEDMGETYLQRLYRGIDKNSKQIDKLLKRLPLKGKSDEEKAFIIENYIKTNVNLVQDAEDDPSVENVLKKKYANVFGITQLHVLCLDRAEIPFETVITCEKDIKRFDPDFDSWSFLEYVVIHLPGSGDYITPGNSFLRCGYLAQDLLGQDALFIKGIKVGKQVKPVISIRNIGVNLLSKSKDNHFITVSFNDDLSQSIIDYKREMSDYAYMGIKPVYAMADEQQKKELIEGIITNGIKEIKVSDMKVENYGTATRAEYQAPLRITAKLTTDAYLESAGDKTLLKLGELIGPQEQIYQEKKRQNPIDMPYSHEYNREIRVKIPKGRKLEGLDKININYEYSDRNEPLYGFTSSYKLEGEELIVTCREHYDRIHFSVDKFEDFRKVINAAADFNKIVILVK